MMRLVLFPSPVVSTNVLYFSTNVLSMRSLIGGLAGAILYISVICLTSIRFGPMIYTDLEGAAGSSGGQDGGQEDESSSRRGSRSKVAAEGPIMMEGTNKKSNSLLLLGHQTTAGGGGRSESSVAVTRQEQIGERFIHHPKEAPGEGEHRRKKMKGAGTTDSYKNSKEGTEDSYNIEGGIVPVEVQHRSPAVEMISSERAFLPQQGVEQDDNVSASVRGPHTSSARVTKNEAEESTSTTTHNRDEKITTSKEAFRSEEVRGSGPPASSPDGEDPPYEDVLKNKISSDEEDLRIQQAESSELRKLHLDLARLKAD